MADPPSSANSDENPPHSLRSYDHKHAKTMTDGLARPQVSRFETLIHFMLRRSLSARGGVMSRRSQGSEKTMMSTVLGMLMMMPVVFGVGGYALVSRRP
jgi:hypothetical protein